MEGQISVRSVVVLFGQGRLPSLFGVKRRQKLGPLARATAMFILVFINQEQWCCIWMRMSEDRYRKKLLEGALSQGRITRVRFKRAFYRIVSHMFRSSFAAAVGPLTGSGVGWGR